MEVGLMTLAPFNETSSTTPKPARSAANHRCKPMRANEQAKGVGTRRRGYSLNSVAISTFLQGFSISSEHWVKDTLRVQPHQVISPKLPLRIQHSTLPHAKHDAMATKEMNARETTRQSLRRWPRTFSGDSVPQGIIP